jgi:hypothetical protein
LCSRAINIVLDLPFSGTAVVEIYDVVRVIGEAGLGASHLPGYIGDMPNTIRAVLVAMALQVIGRKNQCLKFPEIITAANTYADELGWPGYTRDDARNALQCLSNYGILRGGPHPNGRQITFDEVTLTIRQLL